jgi:hypothetical protein
LQQTRKALIQNSRSAKDTATFLSVEGPESTEIALLANDLRRARRATAKANDFDGNISMEGNLVSR